MFDEIKAKFQEVGILCTTDDPADSLEWHKKIREDNFQIKALAGGILKEEEIAKFKGYILTELGKEYAKAGIVMQLHIGAIRNNSRRFYDLLGADTGFDAMADFSYAPQLASLLSAMDETDELPKTILYCLNPKDTEMLAVMASTFCSNVGWYVNRLA